MREHANQRNCGKPQQQVALEFLLQSKPKAKADHGQFQRQEEVVKAHGKQLAEQQWHKQDSRQDRVGRETAQRKK